MEGLEDFLFFLFFFGVNTECFYFENEPDVVVVVLVCDFLFCAELLHCSSSICQKFCLTPPPGELRTAGAATDQMHMAADLVLTYRLD